MLYLLLLYISFTAVCFCAGCILYAVVSPSILSNSVNQKSLVTYLFTGLISITFFGQWIVLFFPLNLFAVLSITILFVLLLFLYKKKISLTFKNIQPVIKQKSVLFFLCFTAFLFMILIVNAGPTIMDDTDSYHLQMIKWAQQYGTVPGIANLHLRFGFNSSWFISTALFTQKINGLNSYLALNGLLSVWISYFLLEKMYLLFLRKQSILFIKIAFASFFVLLFSFIVWPMIRGNAATTNYDFITTCCIIILFVEAISSPGKQQQEWLLWPVYLFTVRMINYPLLLLSMFSLIQLYRTRKIKELIFYFLLMLCFVVPFIIRNTILSGYPFFPIYQIDFFSFDWKADKKQTIDIVNYIKYFNRVNIQNQPLSITMQLQFPGWIKAWYHFLFTYDKILTTVSLLCYLVIILVWKKIKNYFDFNYWLFFIVMVVQLISWFVIAPDPRFVYGPLLFSIFSLMFIITPLKLFLNTTYVKAAFCLMSIGVFFYGFKKIEAENKYRNWIVPVSIPSPPVKKIELNGIELKIPEKILDNWNPRCFDTELPCLYILDPRLRARGKKIQDGFKLEK